MTINMLLKWLKGLIMRFSIIIPTRDRPALFAEALASVQAQVFDDYEIIVVDDGSHPDHAAVYDAVLSAARAKSGAPLSVFHLIRRPNGHGPSYALNYGVSCAQGDYVGFLDDDDIWLESDHLARANASLAGGADLYMSNQHAFLLRKMLDERLWLGPLAPALADAGRTPDAMGCYSVTVDDLMATPGFCHLNGLIVRRAFFERQGGLDETIRWEGDRDLYLRLIDAAEVMLHNPREVARHNIPDPTKTANMTTAISDLQKRLSQLRVVEKAATLARHPRIRAHGREHRAYVLAKIADDLADAGDARGAASYARSAFGSRPRLGSFARALAFSMRAMQARE